VKLKLYGYSPERFMNLCCNHEILLWGVENHGDYYTLYVSVQDFFKLKPMVKKTQTKIVVLERKGLPFFVYKYRKRKLFAIGLIGCLLLLYGFSFFIWDITVEGNYTVTTDVLMDFLEEEDIRTGMLKREVSCENIEKIIRQKYNNITWASVKIQGTRLMIGVKENIVDIQGEDKTKQGAYDLIAEKDGIIIHMITRSGTPFVGIQSEVKAGDILVSGQIPVKNDGGEVFAYQQVEADADIIIETIYPYEDKIERNYEEKKYTGNVKKSYRLNIGKKSIRFLFGKVKYEHYDVLETDKQAKLGNSFYLPIWIEKTEYREYEPENKIYTKEQCNKMAKERFYRYCKTLEEKGVQILENNVKIELSKSFCMTKGTLKVQEKTGKSVPSREVEGNMPLKEENS
jgi:similar to stage IV sporulation protein